MTAFLIVAALMLAVALSFVLPTLLRGARGETVAVNHAERDALNLDVLRDQLRELDADRASGVLDAAGYDSSRRELERRVVEEVQSGGMPAPGIAAATAASVVGKPWTAIGLAALLPVAAIALYLLLGNPGGLDPAKIAGDAPAQTVTPQQITAMVDKLAAHLKEKPDDADGWAMLARSCGVLGRYDEAVDAYAHLIKLVPPNAELLADYADSLAMAQNKSLQGAPEKLIAQALALDPKNVKALALIGSVAFERHDYAAAAAQWKKILPLVPPDSEMAQSVNTSIKEAMGAAGTPEAADANVAAATPATAAASGNAAAAGAQVSGTVELDAALRSQVADTDTVFIFARAVDGPRFPLAVLRKQVKDLPAAFTLDDSMSMMPDAKLSGFPSIVVGARISKSGSATPGPGDLEGLSAPTHPGAQGLTIRIASQHN